MSIKLMSAIFETEFTKDFEYEKNGEKRTAKASTAKLVLLAISDHCNDDGQAYPGLSRLETKTALSRQGICDTIDALKYNGILSVIGINGKNNTNTYQINMECFNSRVVKPLDQGSQATLPEVVKPLDLNHQLTINNHKAKLNKKELEQADQQVKDMIEHSKKAKTRSDTLLPEQWSDYAQAFIESTGLQYVPNQQGKWIGAFEVWRNLGVTIQDVKDATGQLHGYNILSPMSLTNTLNGIIATRKRQAENDPYKNFNWVE